MLIKILLLSVPFNWYIYKQLVNHIFQQMHNKAEYGVSSNHLFSIRQLEKKIST